MELSVTSISISMTQTTVVSAAASSSAASTTAAARHKALFEKMDTNSDGKIDTLELSAAAPQKGKDNNAAALMKKIDTDGNGSISETESDAFLTAKDASKNAASGVGVAARHHGHHHGHGARGVSEKSVEKTYDKLDTNNDGTVSSEELSAGLDKKKIDVTDAQKKEMFTNIDANGDGAVDKSEFGAYKTRMESALKTQAQNVAVYTQQVQITYQSVSVSFNKVV